MLTICCDGASRIIERERYGFIGIVVYRGEAMIDKHAAAVGLATTNEAGYYAVIGALAMAKRHGERRVKILSNSDLVVRQLSGIDSIKNARLDKLAETFHKLADDFDTVSVELGADNRAHLLAWAARSWDRMDRLAARRAK